MDQNPPGRAGHPPDPRPRPPKVSAATYWRRRVLVMGIGVGLVTTLSWAVNGMLAARSTAGQDVPPSGMGTASSAPAQVGKGQAGPASPSPSPRPDPAPSGHRSTTPSRASGRSPRCKPAGVTLSLSSPQYWYQAGKTPRFTVRARSSQGESCRFNMGTRFVAVVITRGRQRIWSSADCATGTRSHQTVLTGSAPAVLRLSWDRRTSSPGCGGAGHVVRPGEYQVTAIAGRVHGSTTNIVLGAKGATQP
jgi:hypothetical protein